jgi:flavin reductase (DIM6/NTAB) family NADH-FMN oxidoreductase RutF
VEVNAMLDDELINKVTWKIPNALTLVGSRAGNDWNGMTTSWVTQVAQDPVLIGVGIDTTAVTHRLIADGGSFTVNLWDAGNTRPFVKFSKPAAKDGMALNGYSISEGVTGAPVFDDAIAWMECEVRQAVDCGTHTFFIGELVAAGVNNDDAIPASMADTRMKYGGTRRGH